MRERKRYITSRSGKNKEPSPEE